MLTVDEHGLPEKYESSKIWPKALVVGEHCDTPSHWEAESTLGTWLAKNGVPGIAGIDTRELTKKLRERGTMLGKILREMPKNLNFTVVVSSNSIV